MLAAPRANPTGIPASVQEALREGERYPHVTNRGVARTDGPESRVLVDWLAYTVPDDVPIEDAIPGGDQLEFVALERGGYGYQRSAAAGAIRVYYDGAEGMGKHVQLTGQACRELDASGALARYDVAGWPGLLRKVQAAGYNITRLDIALDDREGLLDIPTMREAVEDEHYTSLWHKTQQIRSRDRRGAEAGETLSFGSPASDSYCRVYDKAAEQVAKAKGTHRGGGEAAAEGHWVRVEMQLRDRHAQAMARLLGHNDGGAEAVLKVLHQYLDFKTPDRADSNRRRWSTAPWWAAFLAQLGKQRLALQPVERSLDTVSAWVDRQLAPSLALLVRAAGGNYRVLYNIVRHGEERLRPRHLALLPAVAPT